MSKVIHLSDSAHNAAKNFCKLHGLKMSDWVADLIADAVQTGRVDPRTPTRPAPAPTAPAPAAVAPVASNLPSKKKLERFVERPGTNEDQPPWAAPPFWSSGRAQK